MKIIFLNCYAGYFKTELFTFIKKESLDTDIFCFQEVSVSLQKELEELLKSYTSIFEAGFLLSDVNELAGQSMFFSSKIKLNKSEKILLHELKTKDIGFLLKAEFIINNKTFLIGNVHGTAQPGNKLDSDLRINQSQIVIDAFSEPEATKIIGGDFNLLRDTKSINLFEESGYKNLIKEFDIKATRNKVAWERFKNDIGFIKQYDSDYIFVSPDLRIKSFEVPDLSISDHLPLILEFEV